MRQLCTKCNKVRHVSTPIRMKRRRAGLPYPCPNCGVGLEHAVKIKKGASDSQKRSRAQEARVATREGGKTQAGSGNAAGYEGDVRKVGRYRGECKLTRAMSYRLRLEDIQKLKLQASGGELPVMDIEFQGVNPPERIVVMPEWAYETLMVEAGRRDSEE